MTKKTWPPLWWIGVVAGGVLAALMVRQYRRVTAGRAAAEECLQRELSLDETVEASFPASDPPSSIPDPA